MKRIEEIKRVKELYDQKRRQKPALDDEPLLTMGEIRQTEESEADFANGDFEELSTIKW